MNRVLLATAVAVSFISLNVQASTISDVKTAQCLGEKGSFLQIDKSKMMVRGKLGSLQEMRTPPQNAAFGTNVNYPKPGLTALGGLAADRTGYWGNLSLLAENNRPLSQKERLTGFFTDMNGKAQTELLDCLLTF